MSLKSIRDNDTCIIPYKKKFKYYNDLNKYSKRNKCGLKGHSQICIMKNANERYGSKNCLIQYNSNCTVTSMNHKIPTNYTSNAFLETCLCMNPKFKENKKWIIGCICYPQKNVKTNKTLEEPNRNQCNALFRKKCMHIQFGKYDKKSSYQNVNCWIHNEKTAFEKKYLNNVQDLKRKIKLMEKMRFNSSNLSNTSDKTIVSIVSPPSSFSLSFALPERQNSLDRDGQIKILYKDQELDKDYAQEVNNSLSLYNTDLKEDIWKTYDFHKTLENLKNVSFKLLESVPATSIIILSISVLFLSILFYIRKRKKNKRRCEQTFVYRAFNNNDNNNNDYL